MTVLEWFAVYTVTGRESDADRFLAKQFRTFFPHTTEWVWRKASQRTKLVRRAWLPSYLFIEAACDALHLAVSEEAKCHGVRRLVSAPGHEPSPIPPRFMTRIMSRADPLGCMHVGAQKARPAFEGKIGDSINVKEGHYLWNFRAVVRAIYGDELAIELERPILGKREARIPAEFAQVVANPSNP